jgi:hypothetical protein
MELREVVRLVRKRWILAVCGIVLAAGLAVLTYASRAPSPYTSATTLFVTQPGYGFSNVVNGDQLVANAVIYAQIAQSDWIRREIGADPRSIAATVATSGPNGSGSAIPFIQLSAQATTAVRARALALAAARALERYVAAGQAALHMPASLRSQIKVVNAPGPGIRAATRTRVAIMPAIVFMTVMLLILGAIFALENLSEGKEVAESRGRFASQADLRARWAATGSAGTPEAVPSSASRGSFRRRS